jgi:NADH-quinone oxidoreductase subunit E
MTQTIENREIRKMRDSHSETVDDILRRFPQKKSASLPLLYLAWETYGYVSPEAMMEIAEILGTSPAYIQGIASFYTLFPLKKTGKYRIELCTNISCHLTGAQNVLRALEDKLGIHCGECTDDGRFSLETVECLAGCSWAPCMHVNGIEYRHLTPEKVSEIIDSLE